MRYLDKNVAEEMSLRNKLGVNGLRIADESEFEDIVDAETGDAKLDEFGRPMTTMTLKGLPPEVYNSEECELLDAIATMMLYPVDLGDCILVSTTDAVDFATMIDSLTSAKTEEEFELVLSCYGNLGQLPAVKKYVECKVNRTA